MGSSKSPEQVKAEFHACGITISGWARDRGYTPREVSLVLNGVIKGRYGKAHEIAVSLGIKPNPQQSAA